jgi:hypothetical protein
VILYLVGILGLKKDLTSKAPDSHMVIKGGTRSAPAILKPSFQAARNKQQMRKFTGDLDKLSSDP